MMAIKPDYEQACETYVDDPDRQSAERQGLMARDAEGHLRRALPLARRSLAVASTLNERFEALNWMGKIACGLGRNARTNSSAGTAPG